MIVENVTIDGSGKGAKGWFNLKKANVSFDHPFNAQFDHSLNIDFVNDDLGIEHRVAVELSRDSAQKLIEAISTALSRGDEQLGPT